MTSSSSDEYTTRQLKRGAGWLLALLMVASSAGASSMPGNQDVAGGGVNDRPALEESAEDRRAFARPSVATSVAPFAAAAESRISAGRR